MFEWINEWMNLFVGSVSSQSTSVPTLLQQLYPCSQHALRSAGALVTVAVLYACCHWVDIGSPSHTQDALSASLMTGHALNYLSIRSIVVHQWTYIGWPEGLHRLSILPGKLLEIYRKTGWVKVFFCHFLEVTTACSWHSLFALASSRKTHASFVFTFI